MLQVMVDNTELDIEVSRLKTISELVEYIKSSIDPDTIILSLTKDNHPLSENDWVMPLQAFKESKVEIKTGSKESFINERLNMVDSISDELYDKVSEVSKLFRHGAEDEAHEPFAAVLNDLNAFVGWLYSVYMIEKEMFSDEIANFHEIVDEMKSACFDLQSYQMQQSWWNLGDILDLKILSLLERIKELNAQSINKLAS
jgi:hypothetical protein